MRAEYPNQLDYSGFWQQLPSESYPNSASTYSQQLNLADFGNSYQNPASKHTCVLRQTRRVSNSVLLQGAHGVVVSHPLRMRKALGSIPSVSMLAEHRVAANKILSLEHKPHLPRHICSDMAKPFEIFSPALARGHFVNLQQQRLSFLRQAQG